MHEELFYFIFFVPSDFGSLCPQIGSPVYSCPALFFHQLKVSTAFLFRENRRRGRDGWTNRQTDGRTGLFTRSAHNVYYHCSEF